MSGSKHTVDENQQKLAEKARQSHDAKHSQQPNEIAEQTNMKRQQKNMHDQSGK